MGRSQIRRNKGTMHSAIATSQLFFCDGRNSISLKDSLLPGRKSLFIEFGESVCNRLAAFSSVFDVIQREICRR